MLATERPDLCRASNGVQAPLTNGLNHVTEPNLRTSSVANLPDNAIECTPAHGRIRVSLMPEGQSASFTVADGGPGIAADRHAEVLPRFGRLDKSRTDLGSSLGLSIVEAIARLHDATLRLADNDPELRVEIGL